MRNSFWNYYFFSQFKNKTNPAKRTLIFDLYCLGSKNYEGLLLRSEVLYRLSHFRSSLADAENAIKCRPTAHKVSSCA